MPDDDEVADDEIAAKLLSCTDAHWGRLKGVFVKWKYNALFLRVAIDDVEYLTFLSLDTPSDLETAKKQLACHIGKRVCVWPRNPLWSIMGVDVVVSSTSSNSQGGKTV